MKITKAATRPILVIELTSAWIAMQLLAIDPTTAFEATATAAILWYFADRTRAHLIGDRDVAPKES